MQKKRKFVLIVILLIILSLILICLRPNEKKVKKVVNSNSVIYFENLNVKNDDKSTSSIENQTSINVSTDLSTKVNCKYLFAVTAVNDSDDNVYLNDIEFLENKNQDVSYVVKYKDGTSVNTGDYLNAKTSITYEIEISSDANQCNSDLYKNTEVSLNFHYKFGIYKEKSNNIEINSKPVKENDNRLYRKNNNVVVTRKKQIDSGSNVENNDLPQKSHDEVKNEVAPVSIKYNIAFEAVNGEVEDDEISVLENSRVKTEVLADDGYEYDDISCTNNQIAKYNDGIITIDKVTSNTVCKVFYKSKIYNLKINSNGGKYNNENEILELDIPYNSKLDIQIPKREGYIFNGWTINSENSVINNNVLTMGYDTEIVAEWEKEKYSIVVSAINGSGNNTLIEYGNDAIMLVNANSGYTYDENNGSSIVCDNNALATYDKASGNITVSNITKNTTCTIKFTKLADVTVVAVNSKYKYTSGDKYSIVVNKDTNETHDFYVLSSDENTVSLIMSENYETKATTTKYGTERYPSTILKVMPTVSDWNNITTPGSFTDNTGCYQSTCPGDILVNYSGFAARIPTYGEIQSVCASGTCPTWIRGSYWTTSPKYVSSSSMNLYYMNNTYIGQKQYSDTGGYRPVITLPKSYFEGLVDESSMPEEMINAPQIMNSNKFTSGDKYSIVVNRDTNETHDFYVLSSDENTVSLIMSENYETKAKTTKYGTERYPSTILKVMPTVSDWNNITTPGSFTDKTGCHSSTCPGDILVNYSGFAARIPTYGEIQSVCASGSCPTWIRGLYWTTSPKYVSGSTMNLYYMNNTSIGQKQYSDTGGYRPVITLPKSYFKDYVNEEDISDDIVTAQEILNTSKYTSGDKYSIVVNKDTNETHDFYVLSSDENTVSLIMSENYETKAKTTKYGTERYPSTILKVMPTVSDWNNITTPGSFTDNTGCYQSTCPGDILVNYSGFAARIPTYGEIQSVCASGSCPTWIRGSYWTTSPKYVSSSSMNLYYMNNTSIGQKQYSDTGGYRPVITLPKTYFKGIINENKVDNNVVTAQEILNTSKYTSGDKYSIVVNKDTNETHDFYVLSSDENTVSLIMSENYETKATTTKYGTERYPSTILKVMPTVSDWNNITTPGSFTDNTGCYQSTCPGDILVNYSGFAARIPTYGEIQSVCASGSCPTWIRGSYWTTSPKYVSGSTMNLYYMNNTSIGQKQYSDTGGYRPVITLPKTYFKGIIDETRITQNMVIAKSVTNSKNVTSGDKYSIVVNKDTNETHDFYVLSSDENTVSLIMSENYETKATTTKYGTERYPSTILKVMPTVSDWNNITTPGSFTDNTGCHSSTCPGDILVNYSGFAARIPTYGEIQSVCASGSCPTWIRGSYWTTSPKYVSGSTMNLYYMNNTSIGQKQYSDTGGYRPVIVLPRLYFK